VLPATTRRAHAAQRCHQLGPGAARNAGIRLRLAYLLLAALPAVDKEAEEQPESVPPGEAGR
jgi:hypothetical protein